jgi:uncharacterized membrane protein YgdD (TMEM256/DUF423 family)
LPLSIQAIFKLFITISFLVYLKENEVLMIKKSLVIGSIFGTTGVILGAVAAHVLRPIMPDASMLSFKTGTNYQMYHALLLLILPVLLPYLRKSWHNAIFWMIALGILFFSGSIYCLSLGPLFHMDLKWMGPLTPIGGLLLISSWISIGIAALLKRQEDV